MTLRRHLSWVIAVAVVMGGLVGCDAFISTAERLERARQAMERGDPRAAVIDVRNVLRSEPNNANAHLMLARIALLLGDPSEAAAALERAIEHGATASAVGELSAEVRIAQGRYSEVLTGLDSGELAVREPMRSILRGRALNAAGRAREAIEVFNGVLEQDPRSVPAHLGLAEALVIAGRSDTALDVLGRVLKLAPTSAEAHLLQGRIYLRRGQHEQAEPAFERVLAAPTPGLSLPRRAMAAASLVETRLALGKVEEARVAQQELTRLAPGATVTRLLGARISLAEGQYLQGIADLQRLVNAAPEFVQARMLLGTAHLSQGNLRQAERELAQVVTLAPDNLEARKLLARIRLQLDQPDAAIRVLTPALEKDSTDPELYSLLGTARLRGGERELGLDALEQGVRANPDDVSLRLDLAAAYFMDGRHDDAIRLLESTPPQQRSVRHQTLLLAAIAAGRGSRAATAEIDRLVRENPQNVDVLYVASMYFLSQREVDRARTHIGRALEIEPANVRALAGLARIELTAGNLDAAQSALRRALAVDEGNIGVRLALADLALRRDDRNAAIELLQEARRLNPSAAELPLALAQVYLTGQDVQQAMRALDEAADIAPGRADVANAAGLILLDAQHYDAALARFRRAIELDGNRPVYWLNSARAQLALNEPAAARESLEKALALEPDWLPAVSALVLLDLRTSGEADALARARELRKRHPKEPAAAVLEGDVLMAARRYREAAVAYEAAERLRPDAVIALKRHEALRLGALDRPEEPLLRWLGIRPQDYRVRAVLAQFYLNTHRLPLAVREFEAVLQQAPDNVIVLNNLAWLYQQRGDDSRAVELARRAYELAPSNPAVADTYGWILFGRNEIGRALPLLEAAARAAAGDPQIQYHYAAALARAGRRSEAREVLRRALEIGGPDFADRRDAERLLAELGS